MSNLQKKLKEIPIGISSFYFNTQGKRLKKPWSKWNKDKKVIVVSPEWENESNKKYKVRGTFNNFFQYATCSK